LELQLDIHKLNHPNGCCFALDLLLRCCSSWLGRKLTWDGGLLTNHRNLSSVFAHEKKLSLVAYACVLSMGGWPASLAETFPASVGDPQKLKSKWFMMTFKVHAYIHMCTRPCTNIDTHTHIHTGLFTYLLSETRSSAVRQGGNAQTTSQSFLKPALHYFPSSMKQVPNRLYGLSYILPLLWLIPLQLFIMVADELCSM